MTLRSKTKINVDSLSPADAYGLGSALIVPRPIGWIGTTSAAGVDNLAPYSFFNLVAADPPTFVIAPVLRGRKDTLTNASETGLLSVNVVTEETVEAMNATAAALPQDVDEFDQCGLTKVRSSPDGPPMVGEAIANFECEVVQIIPVGKPSGDQPGSSMLIIAEARVIHVDSKALTDNLSIDGSQFKAVGRHAGPMYNRASEGLFILERPA